VDERAFPELGREGAVLVFVVRLLHRRQEKAPQEAAFAASLEGPGRHGGHGDLRAGAGGAGPAEGFGYAGPLWG